MQIVKYFISHMVLNPPNTGNNVGEIQHFHVLDLKIPVVKINTKKDQSSLCSFVFYMKGQKVIFSINSIDQNFFPPTNHLNDITKLIGISIYDPVRVHRFINLKHFNLLNISMIYIEMVSIFSTAGFPSSFNKAA